MKLPTEFEVHSLPPWCLLYSGLLPAQAPPWGHGPRGACVQTQAPVEPLEEGRLKRAP